MARTDSTITLFERYGCKDPMATNYDPSATTHDPSLCKYDIKTVVGCMDPLAENYNPLATEPCYDCCRFRAITNPKPLSPFSELGPKDNTYISFGFSNEPFCIDKLYRDYYISNNVCSKTNCTYILGPGAPAYFNDFFNNNPNINLYGVNGFYDYSLLKNVIKNYLGQFGTDIGVTSQWQELAPLYTGSYTFLEPGQYFYVDTLNKVPWILPLVIGNTNVTTFNVDDILKTKKACEGLPQGGGRFVVYDGGGVYENGFAACLCKKDILQAPNQCNLVGDVNCVTSTRQLIALLKNQPNVANSNLLNTSFWVSLGASQQEAENIVTYPTDPSNSVIIDALIQQNGGLYINGVDYIDSAVCCTKFGGFWNSNGKADLNSFCSCKEPISCPNYTDTNITTTKTREGELQILQSLNGIRITEQCCRRYAQENGLNLVWQDPYCVLSEEGNFCDGNTNVVLTINETLINTNDCDEVTVSAYVYFNKPKTVCTSGKPITESNLPAVPIVGGDEIPLEVISQIQGNTVSFYKDGSLTTLATSSSSEPTSPQPKEPCCYDTSKPIKGRLIIQNEKNGVATVDYIDTFEQQQTNLNTNTNVGTGFDTWVLLTTRVSNVKNSSFNIALEFTEGLNCCCTYDIYIDDISIGCEQAGSRLVYPDEKCPGFDIRRVIDNKKSWVYNPGIEGYTTNVYDEIVRDNGTKALIATEPINDTVIGHGTINRVFAPSVDADLTYRETDYYNLYDKFPQVGRVVERHSKLVLNSKEVYLTFNMCMDEECVINGNYLLWQNGDYVVQEDDESRILISQEAPLTLLQLEQYKKTFQGFWLQFMEQFIPATTIFVSGEKWSNCNVCEEKMSYDYVLDTSIGYGSSPKPIVNTVEDTTPITNTPIPSSVFDPIKRNIDTPIADTADGTSQYDSTELSPTKIELPGLTIHPLERDLFRRQIKREIIST